MIVIPYEILRSIIIFIIRSEFFVSKSPVGSSNNNIYGLLANALAMVTLYYSI